jgi:putative ABC transport system ATP-binding protein
LVNNPDVILADEPTGNLDSATGQSIMEELLRLKEVYQRTVIVITHDSKIAGYAERLIRLEDGRITEDMQLSITSKDDRLINPFQISGEEESDEYIL